MAITTNLKKSDGTDLGNSLFSGNGSNSGNQTFNIIMKNGVDLGRGWYNKRSCYASAGAVGFKNSAGVDVGTLLGKYGTLNCTCDVDVDVCDTDTDGGCFVEGSLLTDAGMVSVSQIKEGQRIWGTDERWHRVVGIAKNVTGSRKVYKLPLGGVVTEDHVIYCGELAFVPSIKAHQRSSMAVLVASNSVKGFYNIPVNVSEIDGAILAEVDSDTPTYSPICEKSFIGYLNGERVLIAGQV